MAGTTGTMVTYGLPLITIRPYFYGSVVQANPAATTMVLNCPEWMETCGTNDITITVGPWATVANHGANSGTFDMSIAERVEPVSGYTNVMEPNISGPQTLTASVHCDIAGGSAVACTTSTAHSPIDQPVSAPSAVIPSNSSVPATVPVTMTTDLWGGEWTSPVTSQVGHTAVATYTNPPTSLFAIETVSISVTAGQKALATSSSGAGSRGVNVAGVMTGLGFCLLQIAGAFQAHVLGDP